ncbi:hypothetical protein HYALB_00007137 [Hymenoscyphus albidus]|uniref:Uncharacterized protein n=1 Tax=Hymenoscyphus albidus TaxID=595503 RepID=A0A9N9LHE4_9HELO|nr:hypothetical protein HYALB_00007137 [Hymenoscyphus albidus]
MGIWRQEENYNRWELTCYLRHENALGWEKFLAGHTTIDHRSSRAKAAEEVGNLVGAGLGWRERRRLATFRHCSGQHSPRSFAALRRRGLPEENFVNLSLSPFMPVEVHDPMLHLQMLHRQQHHLALGATSLHLACATHAISFGG